jgi:hypothetical protein
MEEQTRMDRTASLAVDMVKEGEWFRGTAVIIAMDKTTTQNNVR